MSEIGKTTRIRMLTAVIGTAIEDCSTVDFYNIAESGVDNLSLVAAMAVSGRFEALTAELDALKAENAKLRAAKDDLMSALRPIAMRGHHANPVQHVALSSCRRAREVYYRLYEPDCLVLTVSP